MTKATLAAATLAALALIATPASADVDCDDTPQASYCAGPSEGAIRLASGCVEGGPSHEVTGHGDPGDPVHVDVDGNPVIRSTVGPTGSFFARIRVPDGATVRVNGTDYLPDVDCEPVASPGTDHTPQPDTTVGASAGATLPETGASWMVWLTVSVALLASGILLLTYPRSASR